ncbi:hypothetical protein [Nitratireductor aquibiodomus]|uniref:Spore coat protein U (SCPU) domain-containing protein n=1 Tax=Nitratireductor aquibiodomus TaxID=204799 RepID=A0A1H4IYV9_9HYPH|nr:hypothetical protein [Nitratireductor aquibiodomus]SEB39157.1 hypothetical protein SAMN05216452_0781 [Nitratireductor aquibiodomus]
MKYIYSCVFLLLGTTASLGAQSDLPFRANLEESCTIEIRSDGVLVRDGLDVLDSEAAGGNSGAATVYTTGAGFQASLKAPEAFSRAPNGTGAVTFMTTYSSTGATSTAKVPGSTITPLGVGASNLSVDLRAVADNAIFQKGAYEAFVTVTCE